MTADSPGGRIPVSLVTGFLGSGKTTLIRALLARPGMAGTAVIVNEFGAVGIDDAIFAEAVDDEGVLLLANGCMCCVGGDDLAQSVFGLAQRDSGRPQRIVIETSGLADPAPSLRRMMSDPRVRKSVRLDALVATVDGVNGFDTLASETIALRQLALADRRIITKTDIADDAQVNAVRKRLIGLNPGSPVIEASHGDVDPDRLFGATLVNPETGEADPDRWMGLAGHRALAPWGSDRSIRFSGGADHDPSIGSWLIEETRPLDWDRLSRRLGDILARHGQQMLRLKGVVHTAGDERPLVIHGVQRVFHAPVRLGRWNREPATSIVVIGDQEVYPAVEAITAAVRHAAAAPARFATS